MALFKGNLAIEKYAVEESTLPPEAAVSAEPTRSQSRSPTELQIGLEAKWLPPSLPWYAAGIGLVLAVGWNRYLSQQLRQYRGREVPYQAVLDAIPDFLVRVGVDGHYRELRVPDRDFALVPSAERTGKALADVLPKDLADQYLYYLDQALKTGELQVFEQTLPVGNRVQQEEIRVIKSGDDEALFMIREISDRKQAEAALQQKLQQEQALNRVVQAIRSSLDLATIFATVTAETVHLLPGVNCCGVVQHLPEQHVWKIIDRACSDPELLTWVGLEVSESGNPFSDQLKQLKVVRVPDTREIRDEPNKPTAEAIPGAWLMIPLVIDNQLWGSLLLSTPQPFDWPNSLVDLVQTIAHQLEVAIQQAQLYQQVEQEKQKLLQSQKALIQAQQMAQMGNWEIDVATGQTTASDNLFWIFGLDPTPSVDLAEAMVSFIHPDDRPQLEQALFQAMTVGTPYEIDLRFFKADGSIGHLETRAEAACDQQGQVVKVFGTSLEISDRIQTAAQLKHDALHDGLTRLANRTLLTERLDLSLRRAKRHLDYQFAVLFLDLDNFKVVNDSLGHLVGDELLLAVAALLKQMIREVDLAARLGGDEFVVLLDGIDESKEAVRVAERILAALESPFPIANREIFVGASIGIVIGATDYEYAENLLRDADLAMYRSKQSGRGQYTVFDPVMHLKAVQRLQIESDLRTALECGQFVLLYQPVFYLDSQTIRGFEALIRWQHPQQGIILPTEFIGIAEETGLIEPIGEWVLHSACEQLARWQSRFPAQSLKVSVNLSVKQLKSSLLPKLDALLMAYPIEPGCLILEVTESMLVENVEATVKLLEQVKKRGVHISLDDFGTGYSSLSYLHKLPLNALKIDRSFVSCAEGFTEPDTRNRLIAESIIALSNLLELNAVAEGIETAEQLEWLKKLGCEAGQGYFFSPPVSAEQASKILSEHSCPC